MQRSIDGSGDPILTECAERIIPDHLIFEFLAAIAGDELLQLIHIENRETGSCDGTQIPAASFDGQDARRVPDERVGQIEL